MDANSTVIENVTSVKETDSSESVDVSDAETMEKRMESSNMKKYKSDESIIETSMKSTEEIVECQQDDTTRNEESEEITTTDEQVNNSKTLTTETEEVSVKENTDQENLKSEIKIETNLDNTKDMEIIKEYEKDIKKETNNIESENEKGENTLEQSGESLATDLSKVTENNEEENEEEETRELSEDSFPEVVETENKIKEVENVNLEPADHSEKSEPLKIEQVSDGITNSKKDINNQIEHIISDIDINIKAQEKITQLKEQELQLLQKQKELTNQIHQQQLLAQKLIAENQLREQELEVDQRNRQSNECQRQAPFKEAPTLSQEYPRSHAQSIKEDHKQMYQGSYDVKETTSESRTVDLRKIFTPATDAPEILPRNRKLYASSAFYSPTLHPTVEDQVELARRISHSLSDISNQKSKGQSMYVNRKKRSVKWVHESCGQDDDTLESHTLYKENSESDLSQELTKLDKMPLKLIMNPRGQVRDYNSLKDSINIETGLLSPDNCAELIHALQLHKGRDYQQYQAKPLTSPNILPAYSDAGRHRVQLNMHQNQLIEKYSKPCIQVVKSPWEAALHSGSASTAFVEDENYRSQTPLASVASPVHLNQDVLDNGESHESIARMDSQKSPTVSTGPINPQRELAYKPSVAQGWGGRNVELPKEDKLNVAESFGETNYQEYMDLDEYSFHHNPLQRSTLGIEESIGPSPFILIDVNQRLQKLEQFQKYFLEMQMRNQTITNQRQCILEGCNNNRNIQSPTPMQNQNIHQLNVSVGKESKNASDVEPVNVRELIYSFEKQTLNELEDETRIKVVTNRTMLPAIKQDPENTNNNEGSILEHHIDRTDAEGLYVPKEIALASYAPPPAQARNPDFQCSTNDNQSINRYSASNSNDAFNGFPLFNSTSGLYSNVPPKQQLYSPSSYQKVAPNCTQTGGQCNFSPSPLSFEKLSKFQGSRNESIASGCVDVGSSSTFLSKPHLAAPHFTAYKPSGLSMSSQSSEKSFNNCARGWSTGHASRFPSKNHVQRNIFYPKVHETAANSLPYSDF
ncbi:uncharacterized protein LOC108607395 isoform X2 [Drosophila busckii]|uniref:uncharacterized protein LOC108607395 isoform X2 n=1 Tax=Drosophila busckii TaxID=30019 RepID=UPI00083F3ACE|nr:uncharacterized protein LOC108607395 isoform X2 [Drosophila busckii]